MRHFIIIAILFFAAQSEAKDLTSIIKECVPKASAEEAECFYEARNEVHDLTAGEKRLIHGCYSRSNADQRADCLRNVFLRKKSEMVKSRGAYRDRAKMVGI